MTMSSTDLMTRGDLVSRGFTDAEIRGAVRRGSVVRLTRGVFALGNDPAEILATERHTLQARAAAIRAPGLVVSHLSAVALHGLPVGDPRAPVSLTRPGKHGARRRADYRVFAAELSDDDLVEVDGIWVTTVARTIVDVARRQGLESAVIAAD